MAYTTRDTVIDENETIEELIAFVEKQFGVKGEVVQLNGPAGGWPVLGWTGSEAELDKLDQQFYGGSFD